MNYRPEIDGLRAVAVVPVILFHAGFAAFRGGYVGVDVFFVISGYLITSIIIQDHAKRAFTIANFYERRARRILPALFLVMLATIPFAWMWLWPSGLRDFSESVIAVATFVSNILFWHERGYFDAAGELKPLLHTWSLAVEEQFYLFFPLAFALIWKAGRRWTLGAVVAVGLISFAMAEWGSANRPGAAFYLIVFRAWELLLGSIAALYLNGLNETKRLGLNRELPAAAGLALIAFSVFAFDAMTPFPGFYALLPTVGTFLIIVFATGDTWTGRLLSMKVPVGIGLISYSAYLWHQPMLAMARNISVGEPGPYMMAVLCAAVFPLAYLSWRFVESPFRNRERISRRQIFAFSIAGSAFFIAAGIAGVQYNHLGRKLPPNVQWEDMGQKVEAVGEVCRPEPLAGSPGVETCGFGDEGSAQTVVLYGDSHARALGWSLSKAFTQNGIRGVFVQLPGCETVPGVMEIRRASLGLRDRCRGAFDAAMAVVERDASAMIVSSRWTFFLYPVPGEIDTLGFENGEGGHERNSHQMYATVDGAGELQFGAAAKREAIRSFMERLVSTGKRVVMVRPVPEVGWDIAKLNGSHFDGTGKPLESISTSHAAFRRRNGFVESILAEFAGLPHLRFVSPEGIFCGTYIPERCVAQFDTIPFYIDDDHLSEIGADLVVADIMKAIE